MPVQNGNVLLIPSNVDNSSRVTVKWQQMFSDKSADYYTVVAKNKSQGNADVVVFVAAEWYEGAGGTSQHLIHVAPKDVEGFYQLTVDDKCQYGQKNKEGDMRFVVYHDKGRKPYQHRFVETSLGSLGAGVITKIAGAFGYGGKADIAKNVASCFVGDYLHTF
ncbi:hypothetical protein PsYK624_078870 [Phanerochaete sordida]|uniref:Uncharacterized protein n=1 Tax=Phanerochaete sordida TaxID=48140 RepID=A0A9P3LDP6_9APHY|nr:hypothetical protein PsYK624_078870 [Phanerochaete sordida]